MVLYYSWIMQAHYRISVFLAKIVFLPLQMIFIMSICKTFSLLLPSHNCIIIHNVQFSRCIWVLISKRLNETSFARCFSQSLWLIHSSLLLFTLEVVGQNGLEPSTSRLSVVCSSQLSYWPISAHFFWWRLAGSNRWPPACKAGALPAELNPHMFFTICKVHCFLYPLNWITKSS